MELNLTGGVLFSLLCDIKKKPISKSETRSGKKDPASELEMMKALCEMALGHEYLLNIDSLRTKISSYKNCECEGNGAIPLERDADLGADNADYYAFNKEATYKRIVLFIDTFLDIDNKDAIERFVCTINEIIRREKYISGRSDYSGLISNITNNVEMYVPFDEYLFNVIYFVISGHSRNKAGMDTLRFIRRTEYIPLASNIKVTIEKASPELIKQYKDDLTVSLNARDGWEAYLKELKDDYKDVRIYYDPDREYPFYDVYVHSALSTVDPYKKNTETKREYRMEKPTVKRVSSYSKRVIISGTGGLGKTMLMRHFLLDSIENDHARVPVFVSVKKYSNEYSSFPDYICAQCLKYDPQLTKEKLLNLYTSRRCILILDGFDELDSQYREDFFEKFYDFIRVDFNNIIIMSSRPVETSILNHFTTLYIHPLYDDQPQELVDKLSALHHDTSVGERFKSELTNNLSNTHKSYIENPLLLTLMLRIYEEYSTIPSDRFSFYHKAYEVLSHQHDARKADGGFVRAYKTGLSPNKFADYFKKFCAYSLILAGRTTFQEIEMQQFFDMVMNKTSEATDFSFDDFAYDATVSTGLMYHDFDRYDFIHRSMQEFFCAWYISEQEDSALYSIIMRLQNFGKGLSMGVLSMLDEMIHYKMEKYVYLPYLDDLFSNDPEHLHDCYKEFLCRIYSDFGYSKAYGMLSTLIIEPSEPIYSLCMKDRRVTEAGNCYDLPEFSEFEDEDYYEYMDETGEKHVTYESTMPKDYDYKKNGEPKIVGHTYSFKMSDVLSDPDTYQEYTDIIYNRAFPLLREYLNAREYWESLKKKYDDDTYTGILDLLT